jgi:hypothetical protein
MCVWSAVLQVMEDRPLRQRGLHRPERRLGTRERHVHQPRLLRVQVFTVAAQQVTAIEQLRFGFLFQVGFMHQLALFSVKVQTVVTGHARITLLQPADRFADGQLADQPPFLNPLLQFAHVDQEPALLFITTCLQSGRLSRE